jgi:hemerythrin-like domain-containing protein
LQLKRAEDRAAAAEFLEFFEHDARAHFRIEEEVLLPAWLAGDPNADRRLAERVPIEHLAIREYAVRLRDDATTLADLHALGELLQAHVRFEERELFPLIESGLDERAIARLGRALQGDDEP